MIETLENDSSFSYRSSNLVFVQKALPFGGKPESRWSQKVFVCSVIIPLKHFLLLPTSLGFEKLKLSIFQDIFFSKTDPKESKGVGKDYLLCLLCWEV